MKPDRTPLMRAWDKRKFELRPGFFAFVVEEDREIARAVETAAKLAGDSAEAAKEKGEKALYSRALARGIEMLQNGTWPSVGMREMERRG